MAAGRAAQDTYPLGFRRNYSSGRGPDLHFFHHPMAVGLDRALRRTQGVGGLLVGQAANDQLEDLPFARRQARDESANQIQLNLSGHAPLL